MVVCIANINKYFSTMQYKVVYFLEFFLIKRYNIYNSHYLNRLKGHLEDSSSLNLISRFAIN